MRCIMSYNYLLITGIIRSGTTLISRAIDAHPQIAIAPDPYFGYFREFRNEIYKDFFPDFDEEQPLSDHFFDDFFHAKQQLLKSSINRKLINQNLKKVIENTAKFTEQNAPLLIPYLLRLNGDSYKDLFTQLMEIVNKVYGDKDTKVVGFKRPWVEEFVMPLLRTFPNMKIIYIIRDPRAVIASQKRASNIQHNYPLLFMIRNWRKSFAYALYNLYYNNDRFYFLRYEDLITDPKSVLKDISRFLDIKFNPKMIDVSSYRDSEGKSWTNNSSYEKTNNITTKFKSKWEEILNNEEVQCIEDLCFIEMTKLNYSRKTQTDIHRSLFLKNAFSEELNTSWIKEYGKKYLLSEENINKELLRYYIYHDVDRVKIDNVFLEQAFIVPEFFHLIKNISFNSFK
ncbi:MAG: sulfotransferase [Firmicutes bacterium]|nr:sulfotransferase [Bacillota bacterium]